MSNRHQRRAAAKMSSMTVQASPLNRALTFFAEFRAADNDSDMELRIGRMGIDERSASVPAVVVSLNGKKHGFTADEARRIASIADEAMNKFPNDPESATLPNLIMMLRMGADKAETATPSTPGSVR